MILHPRTDEEYDDTLALLRIINDLREHGPGYYPPIMDDTPWVRVAEVKECYL